MDFETVMKFKRLLEAERQRILENSKQVLEEMSKAHKNEIKDEGDEAQALVATDLSLRFRDRERQLLNKLENALLRIKEGCFGVCEECGEDIGLKRLEIRPIATLCIACKEAEEKMEKTFVQD